MSAVTDVEEYVRWHPDVNYIDVYEGLGGWYSASRVDSILCNLYTQGILRSRRGYYFFANGRKIRQMSYLAHLRLGKVADREERLAELLLRELAEEVALVLVRVHAF